MPPRDKPRHASGYGAADFEQVKAACLTVAVTLGAYMDDLCIVGGLVPALLIDTSRPDDDAERHPGTNDLDVALAVAVLNDERYAEISARLRAEGFEPAINAGQNRVLQTWKLDDLNVTIDFLISPSPPDDRPGTIKKLEGDFGALITRGLELAFDERVEIELDGHTLHGERASRRIPVCGPAAFVVLKALAFGDRGEPKDAYDLVYVIQHTAGRGATVAGRLAVHAQRDADTVNAALDALAKSFRGPDDVGPSRAASFITPAPADEEELDAAAADAHGYVADVLDACRRNGSWTASDGAP